MTERWAGIVVTSDKIVLVDAEVNASKPIVIQSDYSFKLQSGNRAEAYELMHRQIADYMREKGVERVAIKASALSQGATKLAQLHSAELRGVVISASATCCKVVLLAKAKISRTFGDRKVDEYLKDDSFWKSEIVGAELRIGSREAAMMILAARKEA